MTPWIFATILILVLICLFTFVLIFSVFTITIEWDNPNKRDRNWAILFSVLFVALIVLGIRCAYLMNDDRIRDAWFMNNKPTCTEDTVECLTEKAEWYIDSIRYQVNRYPTEQDKINELKDYIKYYEK